MVSRRLIILLVIQSSIIHFIFAQTAIIVVKDDLIEQFKDSQVPRVYNDIKDIKIADKSESKKKGFIRWHYSISSCSGQLSEFDASQVEINLRGDSNSIQINLRNFSLHLQCDAKVKALITIRGSFSVDAKIPNIHVVMSPDLYDREKGLKSLFFRLVQSYVSISAKHDIKFRLHIKNCPHFIETALQSLGIQLFGSNIKKSLNRALKGAVQKGLQRLAEKTDLQTVIPDTGVSLAYSFFKPPKITDKQIFLYLESYFYPITIPLVDGRIPVPSRFMNEGIQLPTTIQQQSGVNPINSYLFYSQNIINSGLDAAAIAKRTYIVDNQFMRLFNSKQVISTKFLENLIPEIGFYPDEEIEARVFLIPDQNSNTAKFGQSLLSLKLKFMCEMEIKRTSQEILTMQILVDINLKDFRGEEGDDGESMMNVYGTIKNINLRDFEIRSANKNFTQDTYDNMETTIETFFIMAQSVVNKDFLRYPYKIPVSVLEIVTVEKAKAYLSPNFGLITAQINGN